MTKRSISSSPFVRAIAVALVGVAIAGVALEMLDKGIRVPPFAQQACGLPPAWLERVKRGYFEPRSGQISILPRKPAYMSTGPGGWSHSGPWPYLQRVPLVFYGPGVVRRSEAVTRPATLADVAPTLARLFGAPFEAHDGRPLAAVARRARRAARPRLIVVVVWDGGGWNALNRWPGDWPNLRRFMNDGVSFANATVGSSPSVTPSVHTTLGAGAFPATTGITNIPVRDENGEVEDAFVNGESSRFLRIPTFAETWDEATRNKALVGMVGYEPWHLGMIGKGAERRGGDKDDAAWLDIETNEWVTNPKFYRLPRALPQTSGLQRDLRRTDAADGEVDGAWRDNEILGERDRFEELPGFIDYHGRAMMNMIRDEGYGSDGIPDLLFTNFKQIDRNGHYYNMASPEVHDSVIQTDKVLGRLPKFLNGEVGRGRWVIVVTADHGQQPDWTDVRGYGINPKEVTADINAEFGRVARAVWPTEAFIYPGALTKRGVSLADVARFIRAYRLEDNTSRPDQLVRGAGRFGPDDPIFEMAIPSKMLLRLVCARRDASARALTQTAQRARPSE